MAFDTTQPNQMTGLNGYITDAVVTIGDEINGYFPPGIPDGMGAFEIDDNTVRVLVNHELNVGDGYTYTLASGAELDGARVSFFDINKETLEVEDAGLAYDTIINREGEVVDDPSDLEFGGIERLCSAQYFEAHQFGEGIGLEDGLFFTGEEVSGGTEYVLDVATDTLHAVPWMGRAAWESVTEINTNNTNEVAFLVGDDREAAPLLLYVGQKDTESDDILERNGLADGKLFVWVSEDGSASPEDFNGTGNSLEGQFVEIEHYREDLVFDTDLDGDGRFDAADITGDGEIQFFEVAVHVDADGDGEFDGIDINLDGVFDYDRLGFATQEYQDFLAAEAGAFQFSRPEDVSTDPTGNGTTAVLASTGRGSRFPSDNWGTTYEININFSAASGDIDADLDILYDGDDAGNGQFAGPDFGLRSPDNLDWADDGFIYINEDRSTSPSSLFGGTSGEEASIWKLDPDSGELTRIAQMDRSALPDLQADLDPNDLGDWESSGILDVSTLFDYDPGQLFLANTQAHSLNGGPIAAEDLVQGGQIFFIFAPEIGTDISETIVSETIIGTDSRDRLTGTDLSETIKGLGGNDRIKAGDGNDIIEGGLGNDRLFGEEGSDTFVLALGDGRDSIRDFEVGIDFIGLADGLTFDDLSINNNAAGNARIRAGGETLAVLSGIDSSLLTEADFVIV
ncbi:MAG: alkaline phosphatase PhoX [Crocosphaera sp.]